MARLPYCVCVGLLIGIVFVLTNIDHVTASCTTDTDCNGHGLCFGFNCQCTDRYTGALCETPPPCTIGGSECGSHGYCHNYFINHTCICSDGYLGTLCATPPICTLYGNECGSHGVCITNLGATSYVCSCTDGYSGILCTTSVSSSPALSLKSLIMALLIGFCVTMAT